MKIQTDIVIVGAGFAGLSTAYHLAKSGQRNILLIEREKTTGVHSSGNNAGMIRQALSDPILASLAHEGRLALEGASEKGWPIALAKNGSLLLASGSQGRELSRIAGVLRKEGVASKLFSKEQASLKVPVLKSGDFNQALFCDTDALIDIGALLKSFRQVLKKMGVRVLLGQKLDAIQAKKEGFLIQTTQHKLECKRVVNASGAWAGVLGAKAGAYPVPLKAYRRHLFLTASGISGVTKDWPFVWDLTHEFYFRPVKQALLMSPCDKELFILDKSRPRKKKEIIEPQRQTELKMKLENFSEKFKDVRFKKATAGLRTMAPDGRFVIGEDPKLKGFFWVAGLGGHGVTTSFSVGRLASDLILKKKVDTGLKKALSPARFLSAEGRTRRRFDGGKRGSN